MKRVTSFLAGSGSAPAGMDEVRAWIPFRQQGNVPSAAVATMDKVRDPRPRPRKVKVTSVTTMDKVRAWDTRRREEMRERIQNEISVRENLLEASDPKGVFPRAKVLASEEALWDLYERWSRYHKPGRDYEEKLRRFELFKKNAKFVYEANHKGLTYKLGLLKYADMSQAETYRYRGIGGFKPKHEDRSCKGRPQLAIAWK